MKKNELVELVDRVYSTWNQQVPKSAEKVIYESWWRLLNHLELEDCHQAIDSLAIDDNYMPRPGGVLKLVSRQALHTAGVDVPPQPMEAWATLLRLGQASASGEHKPESLHGCLSETLNLLGGTSSLSLHTNGDRQSFLEVYNRTVSTWEKQHIKITPLKTTETK